MITIRISKDKLNLIFYTVTSEPVGAENFKGVPDVLTAAAPTPNEDPKIELV